MEKKDILKKLYEKKYIDNGDDNSVLVAPQTPGSEILDIFGFRKEGKLYPEFYNTTIADIGGGLSSLTFELAPSVKKITIVDPIFAYDRKTYVKIEKERAEKRMGLSVLFTKNVSEDILRIRKENQEREERVLEGIEKREQYDVKSDEKILLNPSLAQDIKGIEDNSQDVIFLNFILDKLQGEDSKEDMIFSVLENIYRITKPGGKIYGLHNKGNSENEIINVLNKTGYQYIAEYKNRYVYFIINKE